MTRNTLRGDLLFVIFRVAWLSFLRVSGWRSREITPARGQRHSAACMVRITPAVPETQLRAVFPQLVDLHAGQRPPRPVEIITRLIIPTPAEPRSAGRDELCRFPIQPFRPTSPLISASENARRGDCRRWGGGVSPRCGVGCCVGIAAGGGGGIPHAAGVGWPRGSRPRTVRASRRWTPLEVEVWPALSRPTRPRLAKSQRMRSIRPAGAAVKPAASGTSGTGGW
jgi:hypothetical protein